ncbi:hypothetical protein F8388_011080 [Cannabis sativa]|uniref:Aminotransferase-like plant mobile domain-containing protein n=1 Tax=Cannabis sativa TaxID=3483 RepID=A0A7J6F5Z1_CANSA|nr:hypothetical protein F8388_011080 [Cannabis sativa]
MDHKSMGKRKKTSSNSESLPQAKNNIFSCEHSMAPLLRRDLFPRILETDGIYLYQDSTNDYIVPDGDLPLCYRYSKNDLAVEYRSRSGVIQGWKGWISSVATRFSTPLSSAKILSPMLASSDLEIYRATHTFIVNWGEFTRTLEDVYALLLLPICGKTSLVSPLSNDEQSLLSSLTLAVEDLKKRYIFPSKTSRRTVQSAMFPLACRLAYGKYFPLGAAYLGTLYHNLDSIITDANSYSENKEVISSIDACFLQMFIWERFPKLAPIRKSLQPGEPRPWAWDVSNFTFRPYLTNNCTYFTLDMYPGSVVPLTDEVRSSFTTSAGVYIPLQKSPPLAPSKVCLVVEGHTPVALVGKPSDALGGNSHGTDVAVRPNSEPRPFPCSGTNGDSDATTNTVITRYPLVPSSSSSTFQSTITHELAPTTAPLKTHAAYTDRSTLELCLPAPPSGLLAASSMHVSLERSEDLTTLVGRDSIHLSSHESHASQTHATDTDRSTHELCLPTPPSNLLGASSTYVRLERSEDLTTLVGRDAIHLSSYEPQASQFYSRYTSIDKDFASFFKGLSQFEKILFIQLITPVLPWLQFEYAVSETYCSLLSENWKILCLVFPKQPPILKKLIESYLEIVRSSIRHRQLVEELNTLREARKDLDYKIESLAEHIRNRDPPPSTWTHVPL